MEEPCEDSPPPVLNSLSNGPRRDSTGTGDSNGSVRDEAESIGLSDDDFLEEYMNAENLNDQTPGRMCLYDCSLSSSLEKSLTLANHTLNDVSESNLTRHINDLSCSLAGDCCDVSLAHGTLDKTVDHIGTAVQNKDGLIKELYAVLGEANERQLSKNKKTKELMSQISWLKENANEFSNLSGCSLEGKRKDLQDNTIASGENSVESFRLSSYIRAFTAQNQSLLGSQSQSQSQSIENAKEPIVPQTESRSMQTSPIPNTNEPEPAEEPGSQPQVQFDKEAVVQLCRDFLITTRNLKEEMNLVRHLIKQPYENHEDFPIRKILSCLKEISQSHEDEISSYKQQISSESKHHHELQNTLKDEIKTLKMRMQDKVKQRDSEIAELRARLVDQRDQTSEPLNDIESPRTDVIETPGHHHGPVQGRPPLDDSFHSMSEEETFSNLLSRTKMEYLKLTPSEYVEDEVIDTVHIPDTYRQLLEDYKLKLFDMEKKFDSNKRYLEEQTHDREVERDEFQHALESLQQQIEDLKRENAKLYEVNKQNVFQIEEYAARLKNAEEDEMEMVQKHETTEKELKAAVEKIYELRDIIRDLESQVDAMSSNAIQLKEQNQVLLDELEKQEMTNKKEQPIFNEQDTYGTIPLDVTDEIQTQIQELARKIEGKINEMDSFQMQTRPNSQCSGVASAISTEDISCRELAGRSSRNLENFPIEDFGSVMLNEIRRLEAQFESLVRFEDMVMKKLKDTELKGSNQKVKIEELDNQIAIYQEKCAQQTIKIADLEGQVDAMRFDTTNQSVISTLKGRLQTVTKQLEDYKTLFTKREQEMSQVKEELRLIQVKMFDKRVDHKEVQCTIPIPDQHHLSQNQTFENSLRHPDSTFEGVSPEKIRRLEYTNPLSTSVISQHRNIRNEAEITSLEPELPVVKEAEDKKQPELQNWKKYRSPMCVSDDSEDEGGEGMAPLELDESNPDGQGTGYGYGGNSVSRGAGRGQDSTGPYGTASGVMSPKDRFGSGERTPNDRDQSRSGQMSIGVRSPGDRGQSRSGSGQMSTGARTPSDRDQSRSGSGGRTPSDRDQSRSGSGQMSTGVRTSSDRDQSSHGSGKMSGGRTPSDGTGSGKMSTGTRSPNDRGSGGRLAGRAMGEGYDDTGTAPNIQEMDNNLQELHRLLMEKDRQIQVLEKKRASREGTSSGGQSRTGSSGPMSRSGSQPGSKPGSSGSMPGRQTQTQNQALMKKGGLGGLESTAMHTRDLVKMGVGGCEEEDVTVDITLDPENNLGSIITNPDGSYIYEATFASEYAVEGDLLRYIGTKFLQEGPVTGNAGDMGQRRVAETDLQVEIATLNTQIEMMKRALDEERKKSENLTNQLKACEEEKVVLRSRSSSSVGRSKAPVQNVASSISVHQMQQRELVHQIEEGRNKLNEKHREVINLQDQIIEIEAKLNHKVELEQELKIRLNSTSTQLRKCEEHGKYLANANQEHLKEIRRLKQVLLENRQHQQPPVRNNNEVCPVNSVTSNNGGGEHLENFLRAKSHRKALAWQKMYLSSVILGYKSILRQVGHGTEHPALLQRQIPLAPAAVGLLEGRSGKVRFKIIVFAVLAVIRMKYMVYRWSRKKTGEGSPDSEYKYSRHPTTTTSIANRVDVVRPTKGILVQSNRVNHIATVPNTIDSGGENVDSISEYISRFESLENEISSSLSRNLFPS